MEEISITLVIASTLLTLLHLNRLLNANLAEVNRTIVLLDQLSEKLRTMYKKK
jgi:hypothetical protein